MMIRIVPAWMAVGLLMTTAVSLPLMADTPSHPNVSSPETHPPTLQELRAAGAARSLYRKDQRSRSAPGIPQADLAGFRKRVQPLLLDRCVDCHGPDDQQGNLRIDTLDPDLVHGEDVSWWLEIQAALTKGEMPPADEEGLSEQDRTQMIEWLSKEVQTAARVRRSESNHSSFRRMTRYEYNYAMQDLLGLPYEFARDLPPDPVSEDGFQNSSEMLQMSSVQLAAFRDLGRSAIRKAVAIGPQPTPLYWGITMESVGSQAWTRHERDREKLLERYADDPQKRERELEKWRKRPDAGRTKNAHFRRLATGETVQARWGYNGARHAQPPSKDPPAVPSQFDVAAFLPPQQKVIVELGNSLPAEGIMKVRVLASAVDQEAPAAPHLRLEFGWQASNNSHASVAVGGKGQRVVAATDQPEFYEWEIALGEIYPRNPMRTTAKMGATPSPSEYIRLVNASDSGGAVRVDYVEVIAPFVTEWPPASHVRLLGRRVPSGSEEEAAGTIIRNFMERAWRRQVSAKEVGRKVDLFRRLRSGDGFESTMIEVLATVVASPNFLYLSGSRVVSPFPSVPTTVRPLVNGNALATRLSFFLWGSLPDRELRELARSGQLNDSEVLGGQVQRMLADPRSRRFSEQFVRQWLGLALLDYLEVDRKVYPRFDSLLKEVMLQEPVEFFAEALANNRSVIDFIHSDHAMLNERLARHYGIQGVWGNEFRRVDLPADSTGRREVRGGLLTQAGLLAMNSDGTDSHPLKRGIWLLERILNDPPPPPPPAVPEIDLADPEIAKLTLKERIENHRDHAACRSCHAKIDPWGIAFENYDAIGRWREEVGGNPVDSTSFLFNRKKLDGIDGLKRYLLQERQDQFVRALVHKMATYALGRPLTFGDRSLIDDVAADLRQQGDGLATLVTILVQSELFRQQAAPLGLAQSPSTPTEGGAVATEVQSSGTSKDFGRR